MDLLVSDDQVSLQATGCSLEMLLLIFQIIQKMDLQKKSGSEEEFTNVEHTC